MSIITIVGAGMMGSAMSWPARENGHEVRLVGTHLDKDIINHAIAAGEHLTLKRRLPAGIKYYQLEELSDALKNTDLLISGVSSFGVDWFCDNIIPVLPEELPVLSVTKGMINTEDGSLIPYPLYYAQKHPEKALSLYAVGGPCTSYELADLDHTEVCFCGNNIETLRWLKSIFETSYYHISLSRDVIGVECAVAMKNAYALGVSLAIGLSERMEGVGGKEHYNSQAALFGQSIKEMRSLIKLVGANDDNIVFGAGDLYVTVFGGRTRKIGTLLGRGLSFDEAMVQLGSITLESIVIARRTAQAIRTQINSGKISATDFPLLLHIDDIISNGANVNIPWESFETEQLS